jgi:hypothetical protein
VEDGNRRGEKGRYSPYTICQRRTAPAALLRLVGKDRISEGRETGRPRCIRTLAGTTASRSRQIAATDLMTLFGRIATDMSFPSEGRANVGIPTPRIGPAALTAAPATAEVESAKPTLLPFTIPRCSSLQYGKILAAR